MIGSQMVVVFLDGDGGGAQVEEVGHCALDDYSQFLLFSLLSLCHQMRSLCHMPLPP
jgi:hypothetical protein